MKILVGRRVKLLKTLHTLGGDIFKKGSVMLVTDSYNGLTLRSKIRRKDGCVRSISRVKKECVQLLIPKEALC
jgi:hypothetical protein